MICSIASWISINTPALSAMKSLLSKPPAPGSRISRQQQRYFVSEVSLWDVAKQADTSTQHCRIVNV